MSSDKVIYVRKQINRNIHNLRVLNEVGMEWARGNTLISISDIIDFIIYDTSTLLKTLKEETG